MEDGIIARVGPALDVPADSVIDASGLLVLPGGIDAHIHFIAPGQIEDALHSGVTTMLGGGTGPAHGTLATTCTPGPWHIGRMLQALDAFPINFGLSGKGNASQRSSSRKGSCNARKQ